VFGSLEELWERVTAGEVRDWQPEIVEIECQRRELDPDMDHAAFRLQDGKGRIVRRQAFESW
jgi:hypothetical protein